MTNTPPHTTDRNADSQASGFEAARTARQSEVVEDYVELIAELIHQNGAARPVEIAERLGVTQPTVSKNLIRLKRDGFIEHEPYRSIRLTDAGRQLAETCRIRHRIVVEFLIALGVSPEVAEHDAEGIEHHVSEETLNIFRGFVERNVEAR